MPNRRPSLTTPALLLAAALWSQLPLQAATREDAVAAPNRVVISPTLVTSGQPPATTLAGLSEQGFQAVIYLAPLDAHGAVPDEATIVERQGLRFVHIPIRFNQPTEQDFERFVAALQTLEGRKVLVHCQVNMRASSMVFLYRSIVKKQPPDQAYESVAAVWSPDGVWKAFIVQVLARHGVRFEPY